MPQLRTHAKVDPKQFTCARTYTRMCLRMHAHTTTDTRAHRVPCLASPHLVMPRPEHRALQAITI